MNEATTAQPGTGMTAAAQVAAPDTAATAPAATPPTGTIAGGGHDRPAAADWPSDWRDRFAESIRPGDRRFRERL
jgi:hypothetical protein